MFTIKEAAERAGLSADVLRAWERRYGVVRPTRTAAGYRLYDEGDIARLRAMQRLIEEGFKPREAAGHLDGGPGTGGVEAEGGVVRPGQPAVAAAVGGRGAEAVASGAGGREGRERPDVGVAPAPNGPPAPLVAAARSLDVAGLSAYFDALVALGTFETVCEEVLFPALRALGEAWAEGRVSVAGEHAASAAALRWLGVQYQAAARDERAPQVLVALPPGARHELGALAHAVALRRAGLDVLYLGANLPVGDLVAAVRATEARVVVVGATMPADVAPAGQVATALERTSPRVRLAFGGPQADSLVSHGTVLPQGLGAAAAAVRELLAG